MNTKIIALAALSLASALSAGTANAYMGDGCGRDAQLHTSRYSGEAVCRPIMRAPMPVAVMPVFPRYIGVAPGFGGFGGYGGPRGPVVVGGFHGGFQGNPGGFHGTPGGYHGAPAGPVGHTGHTGHTGMGR